MFAINLHNTINGICHDSHAICYIVNVASLQVLSDYQAEIFVLSALINREKVMTKSIIDKNNYKLITHRILRAHKLSFFVCVGFMLCSDEYIVKFPYQFVGDASLLTSDKACLNEPSSLISTCVDIFLSCNSKNSKTQRLNRCPKNRYMYSKFGAKFSRQFIRRIHMFIVRRHKTVFKTVVLCPHASLLSKE